MVMRLSPQISPLSSSHLSSPEQSRKTISPLFPLLQVHPIHCYVTGVFSHDTHPSLQDATKASLPPFRVHLIYLVSILILLPTCFPGCTSVLCLWISETTINFTFGKYSLCKSLLSSHFLEISSSSISISQFNVTAFVLTISTHPVFMLQCLLQRSMLIKVLTKQEVGGILFLYQWKHEEPSCFWH